MLANWEKLRDMIVEFSLRKSSETFTLASGKKSNLYVDLDKVLYTADGLNLATKIVGPAVTRLGKYYATAVGGPVLGAVMLTAAILRHFDDMFIPMHGFAVYKDAKSRGGIDAIAGRLEKGDKVIIVEDVCTSGGSAKYAKEMVELAGAEVMGFFAVVDRGASGLKAFGDIPYDFLYTMEDFGEEEDVV
jgi:orotate phosphoribosyltransferase